MHIRSLNDAPSVNDYVKGLEYEESAREFRPVATGDLQLSPGGLLTIGGELLELSGDAHADLAKLARIPTGYFGEIDPPLRAVNFNAPAPVPRSGRDPRSYRIK